MTTASPCQSIVGSMSDLYGSAEGGRRVKLSSEGLPLSYLSAQIHYCKQPASNGSGSSAESR